MKEYIKYFENNTSADLYVITDIPFICTIGETCQNLVCDEEGKKIVIEGGEIVIVDNIIPNDEIWYTTTYGDILDPGTNSLPTVISNTYTNGKGVIKCSTPITSIGLLFYNNYGSLLNVTIPNSVISIDKDAFYTRGHPFQLDALQSIAVGNTVYINEDYGESGSGAKMQITLGNGEVVIMNVFDYVCCFVAGTKVTMFDGSLKNIEEITEGDKVLSYDLDNNTNYETTVKKLIVKPNVITFAKIELENGDTITMNEYHPILTKNGWHSITNFMGYDTLVVEDEVKTIDGYSKITKIERWIEEPTTMYTLDVVDPDETNDDNFNDNYFANGICVHNRPVC